MKVVLLGATANPNIGDEAVLTSNIQKIKKMYGNNCEVIVLSKDASYTSLYNSTEGAIVVVDYLHRIAKRCKSNVDTMKKPIEDLLCYPEKNKSYNIEYCALHNIFKDMDFLHIIGGGYINSFWPDMLYEVLTATRLAKKYQKKYCITGISVYPMTEEYHEEIREIFSGAEFADFRDDSYLTCGIDVNENILGTTDDVVDMEDHYPDDNPGEYATIAFHGWREKTDEILHMLENSVVPFMLKCLEEKHVDFFYVMGFSRGDIKLWKNLIESNPKLNMSTKYIECTAYDAIYSKHIVSNAKFNIGSRFHQAVFSLSKHIPVLSICVDDYYDNKLKNIHSQFCSQEIYLLSEVNISRLIGFLHRLDEIKSSLISSEQNIKGLLHEKNMRLASFYGIDTFGHSDNLKESAELCHHDVNKDIESLEKRIKGLEAVIKAKDIELEYIQRTAESKMRDSTTWKVGSMVLHIPKTIKKILHKGK